MTLRRRRKHDLEADQRNFSISGHKIAKMHLFSQLDLFVILEHKKEEMRTST